MRERVRELADGKLVDAVAAGDAGAAAELYRRHHETVRRYALSILRDREDAEDVAQVVMERAIAGIARHRPRRLRAWLLAITRNEALRLLRSRVPKEALSPDLPAAGTVDGTFALREEVAGLVVDLRALPERQRTALVLRQLYELSYRDIGELLGLRPGTARQTVLEARRSLLTRAEGRTQDCGDIRLLLGDGRARRAVLVRAHLEACASCRAAQPSLVGRLKGLLPVPEPMLPPLLLRLLTGPGAGVRTGGAAACLCTFALGLGVMSEVRRGDDGPPQSRAAREAVQPPDRDGRLPVAAADLRSRERSAGVAVRRAGVGAPARLVASAPVQPVADAVVPVAPAKGEAPEPARGVPQPPESEPQVEVEVMNQSVVTVYGPTSVIATGPIPVDPPQELPPATLPQSPIAAPLSAALVGALPG
jgi:RNA polymerase sigma factor (sigma-70 family)